MKDIKLNPQEWTLLLDLKSQLEQAQGEVSRRESAFIGSVFGLCAAKGIKAEEYDLTQMQIKDGLLRLKLKIDAGPQAVGEKEKIN